MGPLGPLLCLCDLSDPQPRHFTWGYALISNSLHLTLPLPTQSTSPTRTVSSSRNSWWGGNPHLFEDQGEEGEKEEMPEHSSWGETEPSLVNILELEKINNKFNKSKEKEGKKLEKAERRMNHITCKFFLGAFGSSWESSIKAFQAGFMSLHWPHHGVKNFTKTALPCVISLVPTCSTIFASQHVGPNPRSLLFTSK